MNSSMIERVARALCDADGENSDALAGWHLTPKRLLWQDYEDNARVTIKAMREPTRKMLSAGGFYHITGPGSVSESDMEIAKREWQAMIDEALK